MGHVFVTQGDLRRLWCDAWLLPTGPAVAIVHYWFREDVRQALGDRLAPAAFSHFQPVHEVPAAYRQGAARTYKYEEYPGAAHGPQPWLTNVGGSQRRTPQWYLEAVDQFVRAAAKEGVRVTGRPKPLLGVPLVGTGAGGQWFAKAEMTQALLPRLHALADELDVDIALVTFDDEAFAAAQVERRNLHVQWSELTPQQLELGRALAEDAQAGRLVLFLGAGVSMGAGLPSWAGLIDDLALRAGFDADEIETLHGFPVTDQARLVERRLGGRQELVQAICERLEVQEYSLLHTFCARMPTETAVTLNYDRLFEQASSDQGHDVRIIPDRGHRTGERTLLKLHGCISRANDIVLTREDYMRFGERRSALAGFVQALLMTHHMLFVGFGLADDNFHRILDDVRKVLGEVAEHSDEFVGTVLTLLPEPLRDSLWDDEMRIVPMFNRPAPLAQAARVLEIFMDYVVSMTGLNPTYLLDATYDGLLSDSERAFADDVRALQARHTTTLGDSPLGLELQRLLGRLGHKP